MLETSAEIISICDAVVDALNAGDQFSFEFTATRFYDPGDAIENLKGLRVAVLPEAKRRLRIGRGRKQLEYDVSVAIIRKIDVTKGDNADGLMILSDELCEYLEETLLASYPLARQTGDIEIHVPYSPTQLRDDHIFLCPATVTYTVFA